LSERSTFSGGPASAFAHNLERFGAAPAIVTDRGETITYAQLAARADGYGARLKDAALVLVEAANEIEPLCAYLGALRAGRPVILAAAGGDHERLIATFRPDARFSRRDGAWTLSVTSREGPAPHPDLAVLLSTSGTTGATKLVRLSGTAVQANAASICEYLGIAASDRAITSLPFHYSYGLSVVNSHLLAGACLVLTDRSVVDPEFWSAFDHHHATSLAGVPYTYELLERIGFRDKTLPTLRTLTQAGGRLAPDLVTTYARWAKDRGVRFFVMYGQTEATARMAYLPPDRTLAQPQSIGVAIPGGSFQLIDAEGAVIEAPDTVGELVYTGPNVMMGYAQAAEDLALGQDLTELRTGDLAARDANGLYRIAGRMSRFAKVYGLRVSLDEVEALAGRVGGARGVAVSDDEAVYVAFTEPVDGPAVIRALASEYKLPDVVFHAHQRDDLPTLASGKVDYQGLLRDARAARQNEDIGDSSDNAIEAAFVRLFPRAVVHPQDSFVSLGGDSLNYVALSLELERALGYLPEGWEQLSVAELCGLAVRTEPTRWWTPRALETEILLRALAVLAVVVNHVSDLVVGGGAEVLLMLAGYNLARYQKPRLETGRAFEFTWSFARRIVAPYYIVLLGFLAVKRWPDIPSLLLVSNFVGRFHSMIEPYWFLEAMLQCLLIISVLCLLPGVRRAISTDPWRLGIGFLTAAVVLKSAAFAVFHHTHLMNRTPDQVLYLMALGWCAYEARSLPRRIMLSGMIAALALMGFLGLPGLWLRYPDPTSISHALWLLACAVGLLWMRRIPVPSLLHVGIGGVAAASFYIYLTHVVPVYVITGAWGRRAWR
jgi:acyl-CoA synthetase (AMP-forming)/AMP-acid ligase II